MDGEPASARATRHAAADRLTAAKDSAAAMRHADTLQRLQHAPLAFGRGHAVAISERQFDVLVNRKMPIRLKLWK